MNVLLCPVEIPLKDGVYDLMSLTNGVEGANLTDSIFDIKYGYCERFSEEQFTSRMTVCSNRAKGHLYTYVGKLNISVAFEVNQDSGMLQVQCIDPKLPKGLTIHLIAIRGNANALPKAA
jgi:hypothetical protein